MEKLDLKDRKILYELDIDSRQSFAQIGKKVGLHKDSVALRVKKLQENEIIEYFFVRTSPSVMGYMHVKIYIRLHNITKQKEEELISELKKKNVYWLSSLRGKYDLVVSIYVKNIGDFSHQYQKLFGEWKNYILDRNVAIHEKAYIYSKAYLLPDQEPKASIYGTWKEKPVVLNLTELNILRYLATNARSPLTNISKKLHLSSDIIRSHIKKLKRNGVITGYGVKIDFTKLNYSYHIISLKLQNMDEGRYKKLEVLSEMNPNIIYFIRSIGNHDAELEIETIDKYKLDDLVKTLRDVFANEIIDYEVLEVTKEHMLNYFPF